MSRSATGNQSVPTTSKTRRRSSTVPSLVVLMVLLAQLMAGALPARPAYAAEQASGTVLGRTLVHGTLGNAYQHRFAVGDSTTGVFLDSGALPLGLDLAPDGTISGVPINGGEYSFALRSTTGRTTLPVTLVVDESSVEASSAPTGTRAPRTAAETSLWDTTRTFFSQGFNMVFGTTLGAIPAAGLQGATPSFAAPSSLTAGGEPIQIASADFNGDGKIDIAASNNGTDGASVWLNSTTPGASTATFGARTDLTARSSTSWGIAAADLNGDDRPELVVADGRRALYAWINGTSKGATTVNFETRQTVPTNVKPHGLAIGDFNMDGKRDVAVTSYEDGTGTTISVLLNTSSPLAVTLSFAEPLVFTVATGPAEIAVADINGDGKSDLAVSGAGAVSVLLNTASVGTTAPLFGTRTDFALPAAGRDVDAADMNGDGKSDLVVGHSGGTTNSSVFLNTTVTNGATPTFGARTNVGTQSTGYPDVALVDLNADGRVDLANRANGPEIRVFASTTEDGATTTTFAAPVALAAGNGNAGITATDLNSDGKPDLVAPNASANSVSVFMNTTGPVPTATQTATNTPTQTSTKTPTQTATKTATQTATSTPTQTATKTASPTATTTTATPSVTKTPVPGTLTYQDVGNVRIWAKSFSKSNGKTTASGDVSIGSVGSNTPYYTVGSSAVWTNGPITLNGTLAINDGATLGIGVFTVDRTTGAVAWGLGTVPSLNRLGNSDIAITPTIMLNVLEPFAKISAVVELAAPENEDRTFTLDFELGPNNEIKASSTASVVLKVAGCDLAVNVSASQNGLVITNAKLTLPAAWNNTTVDITDVVITNDGVTIGNAGTTFPIPDQTLGKIVKLTNMTGKLNAASNGSYTIGVTVGGLVFTIGDDGTTVNDAQFTIAAGKVSAQLGQVTLKVAGLGVTASKLAYNDGEFSVGDVGSSARSGNSAQLIDDETVTLALPGAWKGSTVTISGLTITSDEFSLGGAGGSFPIPDQDLGKVVKLTDMIGKLNVTTDGEYTIGVTVGGLLFTIGDDGTTINDVQFTIDDGKVSAQLGQVTLKVAGLGVTASKLAYNDGEFSVGDIDPSFDPNVTSAQRGGNAQLIDDETVTLALPGAWKGSTVTISGLTITSDEFKLGGAGGSFPIPDQDLGKVVKLTNMIGKLNVTTDGEYTIGVTVGGLKFMVGNDGTIINNAQFTIDDGKVSAQLGQVTLKVAGLSVTASKLAYNDGEFSVGDIDPSLDPNLSQRPLDVSNPLVDDTVTLALPSVWKGGSVTVTGLKITNNSFSLGGAGGTFPIPNQNLGKAVKLNGLTGKLNADVNGNYTFGITAASVVFTAGSNSTTISNVQFTIANGVPSTTIASAKLLIAGLNVQANQITYTNGVFKAGSTTLTLPATLKSVSVSVSGLTITNELVSIGGAGSTFPIPNVSLGSSSVLALSSMKGSLAVDGSGQYMFSISATVNVNKVQTTGGGSGLKVAGTLTIKNGAVTGSVSSLAFQLSGVNFSATNMQFVGDKLTVAKATLTLPVKGSNASAVVYGLELGGSAGFKLQGAKVALPDFKIGTVGVKGVVIEFKTEANGSYTVAGAAKFVFTQFSVDGKFKIGYTQASGVALKSVSLTFKGSIPSPSIPLGSTGFNIVRISGGFDMNDASATISLGLGAASIVGVGSVSLLSLDADVTLRIKPTFSLSAHAGAKVIGIQVATVDLYVSSTAFSLKGEITVSILKVSLEITFGKDASNQFTFYGAVKANVIIPRGYFCDDDDWWCPTFPKSNITIAKAALEGGKFKKGGSVIWGARGSFTFTVFDFYAWAKFAPGTDYGIGDKLESYAPVKPVGLNARALAAGEEPYLVTVTKPAEYLVIMETVTEANRAAPKDIKVSGPAGVKFTQRLGYTEPDGSMRMYRLDFENPRDAVGTWTLTTQTGNIAGMLGGEPAPTIDSLSACVAATKCVTSAQPITLQNGKVLDVAWKASATNPDMTMDVFAQSATGMRYPISHGETTNKTTLSGSAKWTLGLPSGTYTVTAMLESDGVAPVKLEQGVITINDTTGPAAPKALTATVFADMSAALRWNGAAAEADVAGYQVSVDGSEAIAVDGRLSTYTTYGLMAGANHSIRVAAYDNSGNVGAWATVNVTTPKIGVAAAWPMRDSMNDAVAEVGASFNTPITGVMLKVVDVNGTAITGNVTQLTGDIAGNTTVTRGAVFTPSKGTLEPGTYTATVAGRDVATGATVLHKWTFTVLAEPKPAPEPHKTFLPLIRR